MVKLKVETCMICHLGIDTSKESYVHLIDYKEGQFFTEGFYHNKCYVQRISGGERQKKLMGMANKLFKKTSRLLGESGDEEELEVVKI